MKQEYIHIDLKNLSLDHLNPRLPKSLSARGESDIINWMLADASLIELMSAIGNNGFFPGEPLLVLKENQHFKVVEGNRRLASLKLLQSPDIAENRKTKVQRVLEETTERPDLIPCIVFSNRVEIDKYLGFRHVTGVKEWKLLAKARYLKSLISSLTDNIDESIYNELSKTIGSKPDYVKRLLVAYELYDLIEINDYFEIPNLNEDTFYFNYLVDSLRKQHIRAFIGINLSEQDPVERIKSDQDSFNNFKSLIIWFFKENISGKTILKGDSDSLSKLNLILSNNESKVHFVKNEILSDAYEVLNLTHLSISQKLTNSLKLLKEVNSQIYLIKNKDTSDIDTASNIHRLSGVILDTIEKLPE